MSSDSEQRLDTVGRGWQQIIRPPANSDFLQAAITDGLGEAVKEPTHHHCLHQFRVQLTHLERNSAAVAQPHHHTLLHPKLPQPSRNTFRLERRRPVPGGGGGAAEEEEIRDVE